MAIHATLSYLVHEDAFGSAVESITTHRYVEEYSTAEGFKVCDPVGAACKDARDLAENYGGISDITVTRIDTQSPDWTSDHKVNVDWRASR